LYHVNCSLHNAPCSELADVASLFRYVFEMEIGKAHIPISFSYLQGGKPQVADFVHGSDGIGNVPVPDPTTKKVEQTAAEFLVDKVSRFPGEISVLALGPLTNVALVCSLCLQG
jgi:inosine-uridine nucleoside N-ribohydrolase